MHLAKGDLLDEKYRVLYPLGRGGHATVYAARHEILDRPCALKVLGPGGSPERLLLEGRLRNQVDAKWVVPVHDVIDTGEVLVLVMDLVVGCSLDAIVEGHAERLTEAEALALFAAVVRCLVAVHAEGIVHRDLKPSNVLVETRDGQVALRLTDFGSARAEGGAQTKPGNGMGTIRYAAPEQLVDAANVDPRADLYALGMVLYDLFTGGDRTRAPIGDERVPARWRPLFAQLLSPAPADRPPSAEAVLRALGPVDEAVLAASGRIGARLRAQAGGMDPTEPSPLDPSDPPSFVPREEAPRRLAVRGLVAGTCAAAVISVLHLGYDSLPTSPDDLDAPYRLVTGQAAWPLAPAACAALASAAIRDLVPQITRQEVLMWTAVVWSLGGALFGAGLQAIRRVRQRVLRVVAGSLLGFACFFVAHQLPARDARVPPGGVVTIDLRGDAPTCAGPRRGGPLGQPDLEGLGTGLIGAWVGGYVAARAGRRGGTLRADAEATLAASLGVCLLAFAAHEGGVAWGVSFPVSPWVFHLELPHPDRLLLMVGGGVAFAVAFLSRPGHRLVLRGPAGKRRTGEGGDERTATGWARSARPAR